MAEISLTQEEADKLIAMEKHHVENVEYNFPDPGGAIHVPLVSADKRENFLLDVSRGGNISLAKAKYQNRVLQVVILVRLELCGPPHKNPDDQWIDCPHIHLYKEGYGDKWAYPVPAGAFADITNLWQTLLDFSKYCNITKPPQINRRLF